jgi:hypothetical protein
MARPRLLIAAAAALAVSAVVTLNPVAARQSPLKGADQGQFSELKSLNRPVEVPGDEAKTKANREVLARFAKGVVGYLTDQAYINDDKLAPVIQEAARQLPLPMQGTPRELDKHLAFAREVGQPLVAELQGAVKHSRAVVRVNAARMLSITAAVGHPGACELALKILEDPKESEGVKKYALKTLYHAFAFPADPGGVPELTIFDQPGPNRQADQALKHRCIQALCEYVVKPRDVAAMKPEEVNALRIVRRDAVRALGQVKTHRLRVNDQVLARPGLVLLKVANKDGISPEPDLVERVEAVQGFCQLFPVIRANVDRAVQCDYAAHALGQAVQDIVTARANNLADPPPEVAIVAWKTAGFGFDHTMNIWQANVNASQLDGRAAAKLLYDQAKADLFEPLKVGQPQNPPNLLRFKGFLPTIAPKATSLYNDEPATTLKVVGG